MFTEKDIEAMRKVSRLVGFDKIFTANWETAVAEKNAIIFQDDIQTTRPCGNFEITSIRIDFEDSCIVIRGFTDYELPAKPVVIPFHVKF